MSWECQCGGVDTLHRGVWVCGMRATATAEQPVAAAAHVAATHEGSPDTGVGVRPLRTGESGRPAHRGCVRVRVLARCTVVCVPRRCVDVWIAMR